MTYAPPPSSDEDDRPAAQGSAEAGVGSVGGVGRVGGLEFAPGVFAPREAIKFTYARSSGPGGQAVNKLNTRAVLRIAVGSIVGLHDTTASRLRKAAGSRLTQDDVIVLQSDVSRSQRQNRLDCESRLRDLVQRALKPPKKRKPTKPTKAGRERRLQAKREVGEKKRRRRGEE